MSTVKILVIDDEPEICGVLKTLLTSEEYHVETARTGKDALSLIDKNTYNIVITDLKLPTMSGIEIIQYLQQNSPDTIGFIITGYGTIETAVEAMKSGAYDYLTKPFEADELKILIRRSLEHKQLKKENVLLKRQIKASHRFDKTVGNCQKMQELFELVKIVADSDSTVLILGDSGTGKELIARELHYRSHRSEAPLVPVNCGAIPEELLESELFGHVKGAFTGAITSRAGRFQMADGGTIFLDEIGDMSPRLQVKVLRVLQEQEFEPVGSTESVRVNVRIIAATNQNLEAAVKESKFREDLYYRLNVIPIHVPSLRERPDDIPLLLEHFVNKFNREKRRNFEGFDEECILALQCYTWQGNVRELENLVERMVVLKKGGMVSIRDLPTKFSGIEMRSLNTPLQFSSDGINLTEMVESFERDLIHEALKRSNGIKSRAAELLHLKRTTLVEKMKKKQISI